MRTPYPSHRALDLPLGARWAAGFSMIEVLFAACILVAALTGIAAVLPTADMTLHQSGQISKAASLAQEMIEMIKNDPFTELTGYSGVDTRNTATFPVDTPSPPIPHDAGNFLGGSNVAKWVNDINLYLLTGAGITNGYGTITVNDVASGTGGAVLRKVTVTVYWTEGGRPYRVSLATLASAI
jgi:type II secretory pathway pseudopilin PulG